MNTANIAEYLFIISPDESTNDKLMTLKDQFSKDYKCSQVIKSKPHITLINFIHQSKEEDRIARFLSRKTKALKPFKVDVNAFGEFPSHTIFAKVTSSNPIKNAVKVYKEEARVLKMNPKISPFFCDNPHITIARKLTHWQHENGWKEWQHHHFRSSFQVGEFKLLKKTLPLGKYQEIAVFPLLGSATDYVQGCLF